MTTSAELAILDAHYMARALELARKGHYTTHPNPRVGCVIVRAGRSSAKAGTSAPVSPTPKSTPCAPPVSWPGAPPLT